jgi:hypothetical protein
MANKRIHIRLVSEKHRISSGVYSRRWSAYVAPPDLGKSARRFWDHAALTSCDGSIVATLDGKIVGFMRFYLWPLKMIQEAGTWVLPSLRRSGLALKMWKAALEQLSVKTVKYRAISHGGKAFVPKLKEAHPNIVFRSC